MERSVLIGLVLICFGLSPSAQAQEPLLVNVGAHGGTTEFRSGSFITVGAFAQAGSPDGVQFRLALALNVKGDTRLSGIETLVLSNFQFGARIYLGAGVGIVGLTSGTGSGPGISLIALAGLKTRPIARWTLFVEGAFYYGFLRDEQWALRWSFGPILSF